jgi:hypothetical protein
MYVPVSTLARTHIYKHVYMCSDTPLYTYIHTHTSTHTHTHPSTHTCLHMHTYALTHIHVSLYMCIYNYKLPTIRLHKKGKLSCQMLLSYILPFYWAPDPCVTEHIWSALVMMVLKLQPFGTWCHITFQISNDVLEVPVTSSGEKSTIGIYLPTDKCHILEDWNLIYLPVCI